MGGDGAGHGGSAGAAAVFGADAEIAADLAAVDWTATPLGPPESWPQSLQTAVGILLSSRFPMWLAWGPELTFFCNAAYRRDTLGRKYPWALGRPTREVWPEIWDDVGPRIEQVISTGQATWDEALRLFLKRAGYPEETYHTFSYSPLRDDSGRVAGMLCVVVEDTERVIAARRMSTLYELGADPETVRTEEQALAYAAGQLAGNQRDLPFTLTYLFDDDGTARLAAASGIPAGHPAAPSVLPAGSTDIWPMAAPARGESALVDLTAIRFEDLPAGDWSAPPTQALVAPLVRAGGAPYGFLVAALNRYRPLDESYRGFVQMIAAVIAAGITITRSYRTQQRRADELAELDRAKTAFFANVSHEFRTPLTLIMGPLIELRSRLAGAGRADEQAYAELTTVHRNGLRLAKLVNTLLDFSRIEAGRMEASYRPVDFAACTAELASVFRSAAERAALTLTVDCPPLDEPVYLDRDMWEKVVFNLLSNAVKYTFDGGITVRTHRDGTDAVLTVTDTGTGIPAAELPRLFERFHRIETARARSSEGSGIGLALVKELVGLHGGVITADSTEGDGTTFTIRLPFGTTHLPADSLAAADDTGGDSSIAEEYVGEALRWSDIDTDSSTAARAGRAAEPAPTPGTAPARVLVADDNTDMRRYVARLLRSAGYQVDTVTDGAQALTAVRADLPDLVISDVMMPWLDGLELVTELRADPATAAVPVLLLSARAGQEASVDGLRSGADDYLVKPFAAADLLARVRTNIELARLRNHHTRWRRALVDSIQQAFFVCDERGVVIETNTAFAEILGFGPEGLPYRPTHPWWPDADTEPDARRQVADAFAELLSQAHRSYTIPVRHRDGHRVWISVTANHVEDPATGRRVIVGTFRDVTAERYTAELHSALAALGQRLVQADNLDAAVQAAAEEVCRVWQADRVLAVTFAETDSGQQAPPLVAAGAPAQWDELPARTRQALAAVRDGELLGVHTSEPGAAGIAVHHPQGVLVIWVELPEERMFTGQEQTLLTVLAGRVGQGLQRVHQHDQQRDTALALQHAILGPADLPGGFAVRYQPASSPLEVGGDWYDVVDLDDGRVALIVGDCVGHGLPAAAIMGQLRSACRALLLDQHGPAAALAGLDRFAARLPGAESTTAFCAVLNPDTGELVYSSAGHPPPVLVDADGAVTLLDAANAVPLGVQAELLRSEAAVTIPARATLLVYTDGLVERRGTSPDRGIARAAGLVQRGHDSDLDELAGRITSRLAPRAGYQDDVAVLLYRQPAPLQVELPAEVSQLATARAALRRWLSRAGLNHNQTQDVVIAVGEAVTNAVEHGHRDVSGGTVRLQATASADRLQVTVSDTGSWKPPQPAADGQRGRGIPLMRACMDQVVISPGAGGTVVELQSKII